MRHLLQKLDCEQKESTLEMEDNQTALKWSNGGVRHEKNVSVRYNFIKEKVVEVIIRMVYCRTDKNEHRIILTSMSPERDLIHVK